MKDYYYIDKIKNFLLSILFPVKCIGCKKKNEILCDFCISKIQKNEKILEKNVTALFNYKDPLIKKIIWELKYHHKRYLGEKLGQLLYEFLIEDIADIKAYTPGRSIFVIPVPISNKKNRIRGYNQSCAIAKGFCNRAGIGIFELKDKIIFKNKETIPQAKITNRKKRLENIRGVFEIKNSEIIKGRTIIVIDDVTTTGGTINEIMKIIKENGAKRVLGFTIAH